MRAGNQRIHAMTPYYQRDNITLYHADYRDVMAEYSGASNLLVLADPPYGIDYDPNGGCVAAPRQTFERVIGDDEPFDPAPLLKNFDNLVLWGANHYASRLPDSSGWLTWVKIGDGLGRDCSDVELAWTSRQMPARRFNHIWRGMIRDSERGEKRRHPTQKPVALFHWCLDFFPLCDVVFDPFMGSSPVGVAAIQRGLRYIGCDISKHWCQVSAERLDSELDKGRLFSLPPAPANQLAMVG